MAWPLKRPLDSRGKISFPFFFFFHISPCHYSKTLYVLYYDEKLGFPVGINTDGKSKNKNTRGLYTHFQYVLIHFHQTK